MGFIAKINMNFPILEPLREPAAAGTFAAARNSAVEARLVGTLAAADTRVVDTPAEASP